MLLGSKARAWSKAWSARSRKPARRKSAAEAGQGMRALRAREVGAGQERLVDLDGPLDLARLALQVAQQLEDVHGLLVLAAGLDQLREGERELARGQVVQALRVVGRGSEAGPVAQAPVSSVGIGAAPHEARRTG